MPKLKSKSSVKKRFSRTGTGKIKRAYAFKRHCLGQKPQKMKRAARGMTVLDKTNFKTVVQFMPYT